MKTSDPLSDFGSTIEGGAIREIPPQSPNTPKPDPDQVAYVLLEAIRRLGLRGTDKTMGAGGGVFTPRQSGGQRE